MSGPAILAPTLLALGAAFCFALALILTQYGLRTGGGVALMASYLLLRDERLHAVGLLGSS